jgi:uncharacterized protein (TIGR03437 family)
MKSSTLHGALRASLILFLSWLPLAAQQERIGRPSASGPIDSSRTVVLRGNVSPKIPRARDLGRVDPSQKMSYITLAFRRTAAQQAVLDRLLVEMQDPSSPNFHKWLSPEEFGQRFGPSANDIAQVSTWLKSQGLTVEETARGRGWIIFSGTAAQVEHAFQTEVHAYQLDGERHVAIATEPSLPAALAPLVWGFRGLDDFFVKPSVPHYNPPNGNPVPNALVAGDIQTIYDITPLYSNGIDGTGQTVAVVGASDVYSIDLQDFASGSGQPAPQVQTQLAGADPGVTGAQGEADIDLQWLGAVAPNATIIFVVSDDPYVAGQYAIDQNYAPVLSMSFSSCEADASGVAPELTQALGQQANAQGITWLVATGDQASAPCDRSGTTGAMPSVASHGLSVNFPATLPEVTAVGGTMFNEGGGNYWASQDFSNNSSALSYIPEVAWNETAVDGVISGSTGGVSTLFAKPAWQTGPGVPNDGQRDVPDVALDAAAQHDPYLIFTNGGTISYDGGTSVATPIFAGLVVLLNQYLVKNGIQATPGLGNINPALYRLAQTTPQSFHDITQGSNIVPCQVGTPDCSTGSFGYSAGPGYDLVTGLGSVDAANLITNWSTPATTSSTGASVSVTANPSSLTVEGTTVVTATVQGPNGSATPAGSVSFVAGTVALGTQTLAGSGNTATASVTVYGSQLPVGSDTITASYAGSSNLNSASGTVTVNVALPPAAAAVVPSFTPNPVYKEQTDSLGYSWFFTVTLTNMSNVAATLTGLTFAGTDISSAILPIFGSSALAADGTLQGAVGASVTTVPSTIPMVFSGVDANNNQWSQQISIPFYGPQTSASIALSSSPTVVEENPNAPADCAYLQQLDVQERNGVGVNLTRFTIGSHDYTSEIQNWFESLRLAPFGALEANICVGDGFLTPPATLKYELDGVDIHGNDVVATGSALFKGPASNPGELLVSSDLVVLSLANSGASSTSTTLDVVVPANQSWTVSVFPSNQTTNWLVASPLSGSGPGQLTLTASGAGLANSAYIADLAVQSLNTIPQFIDVPVALLIGGSDNLSIAGVTNGASFLVGAAPGMVLSVFGTNLAPSTQEASSVPLPLTLAGVSATIDGVAAPLYFVSSGQLNIQVPYETPAGTALLAVNNNGQVTTWLFDVSFSYPGIFVDGNGNTVPYASGKRGEVLTVFITGEGDVTPPLATGASPKPGTSATELPTPVLKPQTLTIGGVPAKIDFIGIPPYLAGVTQVNFTVPNDAPLGLQPVAITIGTGISAPANFTVNP